MIQWFRMIANQILGYIRRIDQNRIVKLIRNSLIYNMFIMFLIIMLFLQILFFVSPKRGSVSYNGPIVNTAKIQSESANLSIFADFFTIKLDSKDEIFLDWVPLLLIPTGKEPLINVQPVKNEPFRIEILTSKERHDATKTISSNILPNPQVNITYNYWDIFINSNNGFLFDLEKDIYVNLTFSNIDAYTMDKSKKIEKVESFKISDFDFPSKSTLRLMVNYGDNHLVDDATKYNISFIHPSKIQFVANGDFYVSYSSKENKYNSTMREIELLSNEKLNGEMKCECNNIKINLYGQVDKGTIDGHSIFPSFLSWYYENIYFAPLTLISTLIGGIALMKKRNTE